MKPTDCRQSNQILRFDSLIQAGLLSHLWISPIVSPRVTRVTVWYRVNPWQHCLVRDWLRPAVREKYVYNTHICFTIYIYSIDYKEQAVWTSSMTCTPSTKTRTTVPSSTKSRPTTSSMATGRNIWPRTWKRHGKFMPQSCSGQNMHGKWPRDLLLPHNAI